MSKKKGVVCWHSNHTGYESEGEVVDYDTAVEQAEAMNKKYPKIAHWVREVEDEKEAETD